MTRLRALVPAAVVAAVLAVPVAPAGAEGQTVADCIGPACFLVGAEATDEGVHAGASTSVNCSTSVPAPYCVPDVDAGVDVTEAEQDVRTATSGVLCETEDLCTATQPVVHRGTSSSSPTSRQYSGSCTAWQNNPGDKYVRVIARASASPHNGVLPTLVRMTCSIVTDRTTNVIAEGTSSATAQNDFVFVGNQRWHLCIQFFARWADGYSTGYASGNRPCVRDHS